MSDLSRARLAGIIGTVIGFLIVNVVADASLVTGTSLDIELVLPLISYIPTLILVGYAVWLLARLAASPRIFQLYLAAIIISLGANLLFLSGLVMPVLNSTPPVELDAAYVAAVGYFGANLLGNVLVYLSFAMISQTLGYGLFRTAALVGMVSAGLGLVLGVVPGVFFVSLSYLGVGVVSIATVILGLTTLVLTVAAFNSLGKVQVARSTSNMNTPDMAATCIPSGSSGQSVTQGPVSVV